MQAFIRGLDPRIHRLCKKVSQLDGLPVEPGNNTPMRPVFRFAPSPNGYLHLGHALSALLNAELAARCDGLFLLRIEDIDATRCKPEYEAAIFEDLRWLGLTWQEPVRRQSAHLTDYRAAIERLARDKLVYRSFETRADIARLVAASPSPETWPRDPDGAPLFPGAPLAPDDDERLVSQGVPFAWRLDMKKAMAQAGALEWMELSRAPGRDEGFVHAKPELWGDVVLARKETPTSYHLSVVTDDAIQGVNYILRGADLYEATSVHRVLQTLLGLPEPRYSHHRLVPDRDGRKLSKSAGAPSLRELRREGITPEDVRRRLGLA